MNDSRRIQHLPLKINMYIQQLFFCCCFTSREVNLSRDEIRSTQMIWPAYSPGLKLLYLPCAALIHFISHSHYKSPHNPPIRQTRRAGLPLCFHWNLYSLCALMPCGSNTESFSMTLKDKSVLLGSFTGHAVSCKIAFV